MQKKPVYVQDLRGGSAFIGHASTTRGAATVAKKYGHKLCAATYESEYGRFIAPVVSVTEGA